MKKPIEQQVAELTPEQRGNLGKAFKLMIMLIIISLLIGILTGLVFYAENKEQEKIAKEKYDETQAKIDEASENNIFDLSLYDDNLEAMNEYYDKKNKTYRGVVYGGIVASGCCFASAFYMNYKYPYFSEKKYFYLKKLEKNKDKE